MKQTKIILGIAILITLITVLTWQITGGDYYTKFQVVEEIERPIDPNDPLAAAGFYDDQAVKETVIRDEFRLGLLPTPNGIFDKHLIAVITLVTPIWIISLALLWWRRRQRNGPLTEAGTAH